MTTPLAALLFFAMWTLGLVVLGLGPYRVGMVLAGQARPNAFPASTPHGPDWYQRLMRAHANCVENLPVFGVIVGVGHAVGLTGGTFGSLAVGVAVARVGQSLMHISSGRSRVINVRFAFFAAQVVMMLIMAAMAASA